MRPRVHCVAVHDYHVHSSYSDGYFLEQMVSAAEDAGLDGVGIADHCNVSARDSMREYREAMGFNLDMTYQRRRAAIERRRAKADIAVHDAAEIDYPPADEAEIEAFLDGAQFDYAVGSVHELRGKNVHEPYFERFSETERQTIVDEYFDAVVSLVDSGLFDILAHPDIVERNTALRGLATEEQYREVAAALESSGTVPELNAGRINSSYGRFHPNADFLSVLSEYDIEVTIGSDAHKPDAVRDCVPALRDRVAELDLTVASPSTILDR